LRVSKEFNHARKTARDVLGLRGFTRDLREHVAAWTCVAILHHQVGAGGQEDFLRTLPEESRTRIAGWCFFSSPAAA